MRSFVLFLVGMLLGACGTHTAPLPAPSAPTHMDGAATLKTMTVGLVGVREDGSMRPYCSGVWVSRDALLTARHCLGEHETEPVLYVVHGDVYPNGPKEAERLPLRVARAVLLDDAHDLALLRADVPPAGHGIARTRIEPIVQGMFAQAMGHSLGLWYSYSSGDVSAVREKDFDDGVKLWLQSTAPISPGNSGGGLFDSDASLVGICHGSFTRGQALNLFVHQTYVDALLAKARAAGTI